MTSGLGEKLPMPFVPAIESIATLLTPLPITWGFCGGWAIDLFLNRITRSHKDVDIAILRTDQHLVFDFLQQPALDRVDVHQR